MYTEAKSLKCMGVGDSYRVRLRRHIPCLECKAELTAGSIIAYRHHMHQAEPVIDWNRLPASHIEHHPQVYDVRLLQSTNRSPCPFPGCTWSSCTWNGLCFNFSSQHWGGITRILDENPNPLPKCERCGRQVPLGRLNTRNYAYENCKQGEKRKILREILQHCFGASRVLLHTKT